MRIMTRNARHGGGARAQPFAEQILRFDPDTVIITEYRNNAAGQTIKDIISSGGLCHHSDVDTPPRENTVLAASKLPFSSKQVPGLGRQSHRGVWARFSEMDVFGFYFPQQYEKLAFFDAIYSFDRDALSDATLIIGDINTGSHYVDEIGATFFASKQFEMLSDIGWIDVWRTRNPGKREYSWFSDTGNGFRVDHAFATPELNKTIERVFYDHSVREQGLSDHSALIVDIPGLLVSGLSNSTS